MVDCFKKTYATDGFVGMYRGFSVSILGIFVYRAFYFGLYDTGKRLVFGDDQALKNANFFAKFFFAQLIVSTSETISFPLDTVRRRMMMESGKKLENRTYLSTPDCFRKTYA